MPLCAGANPLAMAGAAGWASSQGALREGLAAAHSGRPSTIIHICQYQEFLIISTAVAQRFKLLSLFLKVAGSIPGVVNSDAWRSFFFWRRLRRAKRQTQPARGAQTPAALRVAAWFRASCAICWRHCHAPSSTTHAPMFLVRTCRSKVVSVRTPKLAIPGPQSAPCAGLQCQIPLGMQHKEGIGAPGSACGAPQAPAARAGLVWLWPALFGVVFV